MQRQANYPARFGSKLQPNNDMRTFAHTLSNGGTILIHYNPNPSSPGKCVTELTGEQNFSCWNELLDALLGIYEFHARQTGQSFDLSWSLPSGRQMHFTVSPDKPARTASPDKPPAFSPEDIRAQIAAKLSPELLAKAIGSLPEENANEIIRTYFTPRPTKRSQRITIQKP